MNPFRRKKMPHPDTPNHFYYTAGDQFSPGAEGLALETTLLHPLQGIWGGGVSCGTLRVTEPQRVYQFLALPQQTLIAGIQAGALGLQNLDVQNPDGSYSDAPVM